MNNKKNINFYDNEYSIYFSATRNRSYKVWDKIEFLELLSQKSIISVIAPHPNQGILVARNLFSTTDIILLEVKENSRRKGIGSFLLGELFRKSLIVCSDKIILEVAINNYPAISLYTKAGFEKTGIRKNYYNICKDKKVDAIVMTKSFS